MAERRATVRSIAGLAVWSLFRSCDVLVLPTKADAFGIVAAEASACGLAVIMSDVGGARDIVVEGETGYLLAPGDLDLLVKRLSTLARDPDLRRRMGRAARARAQARFDAKKNGKKVVDTLVDVVETRLEMSRHQLRHR